MSERKGVESKYTIFNVEEIGNIFTKNEMDIFQKIYDGQDWMTREEISEYVAYVTYPILEAEGYYNWNIGSGKYENLSYEELFRKMKKAKAIDSDIEFDPNYETKFTKGILSDFFEAYNEAVSTIGSRGHISFYDSNFLHFYKSRWSSDPEEKEMYGKPARDLSESMRQFSSLLKYWDEETDELGHIEKELTSTRINSDVLGLISGYAQKDIFADLFREMTKTDDKELIDIARYIYTIKDLNTIVRDSFTKGVNAPRGAFILSLVDMYRHFLLNDVKDFNNSGKWIPSYKYPHGDDVLKIRGSSFGKIWNGGFNKINKNDITESEKDYINKYSSPRIVPKRRLKPGPRQVTPTSRRVVPKPRRVVPKPRPIVPKPRPRRRVPRVKVELFDLEDEIFDDGFTEDEIDILYEIVSMRKQLARFSTRSDLSESTKESRNEEREKIKDDVEDKFIEFLNKS
jgi:hypothetical protein